MENIQVSIGQRLKEAREGANLSQEELGELIKRGKSAISQYEKGITPLSNKLAFKISEHLKIDVNWLLTGLGENPSNTNNTIKKGSIKGNVSMGGSHSSFAGSGLVDECWEELKKTRAELELWRNKYIQLLERRESQC